MVVIPALDRFGRDSIEIKTKLALFDSLSVKVISLTETIERDTPEGRLQTGILAEFAEFERAKLRGRVRRALAHRKASGKPVGAIGLGWHAEPVIVDGEATTRRVADPQRVPDVVRIFTMVADGHTYGDIARALNADAVRAPRDARAWTPRQIRRIVENTAYIGEKGYPALIDEDLWKRAQKNIRRLDPVAVQARKGGQKSPEEFLLRGIAHCGRCGASLYARSYAKGRHYLCANVRQATGLCDAPAIPASVLEARTLEHLHQFKFDVERWVSERVAEGRTERAVLEREVDGLRREAAKVSKRVEHLRGSLDSALDADDGDEELAGAALRQVGRVSSSTTTRRRALRRPRRENCEWTAEPDVNAALDYYNGIVDLIEGRIQKAQGAAALNVALRDLLASVSVDLVPGDEYDYVAEVLDLPRDPNPERAQLIRAIYTIRAARADRRAASPCGATRTLRLSRRCPRPSCTSSRSARRSPVLEALGLQPQRAQLLGLEPLQRLGRPAQLLEADHPLLGRRHVARLLGSRSGSSLSTSCWRWARTAIASCLQTVWTHRCARSGSSVAARRTKISIVRW